MANLVTRATRVPLAVIDRIGNAELTERLGLRQPFLRVVQATARTGARAIREGGKAAQALVAPVRLPRPAPASEGFDLTPTDEQVMMRDTARKFAADVLRPAAAAAFAAPAAAAAGGKPVAGAV